MPRASSNSLGTPVSRRQRRCDAERLLRGGVELVEGVGKQVDALRRRRKLVGQDAGVGGRELRESGEGASGESATERGAR